MNSINVKKMEDSQNVGVAVYDISLDGTVVNALGSNVISNTDGQLGFNFSLPTVYRYTDENPYIGKGLGRNVKEGKAYTKAEADVAEFEDLFLNTCYNGGWKRYGLDIDEYISSSINVSRKNYSDELPDGSIKFVGNTIKSRKMSGYLENFINDSIGLLLHCEGKKFLDNYYDYIDKIYNYQIPIRDIASKGNIKKSLDEYLEDMKTVTKSGSKKSRQAWYELALISGAKINVSDTIFYVNTGKKGTDSDVKRVTHQFIHDENGNEIELVGKVKTQLLKAELENGYTNDNGETIINIKDLKTADKKAIFAKHVVREEDEIILNCKMVPQYILEDESKEYLCSDVEGLEYNVEKYIEQFNNRIKPLLVCFSRKIRDRILIKNPEDRQYFTEEEAKLVSGEPNDPADQDTYEALMTPESKEIAFWTKIGEVPPFVKECNIDWDNLVKQYEIEKKQEEDAEFQEENEKYLNALESLTNEEVNKFEEEGEIPSKISSLMTLGSDMYLYFKRIPNKRPSTGGYIFDDIKYQVIDTVDDFGE